LPFIEVENKQNHRVGLWKITETVSELMELFQDAPVLGSLHNSRNLQSLASRLTLMRLMDLPVLDIIKTAEGKPSIDGRNEEISLSHSGIFAAAIVSKNGSTGIDIERMDERIFKIAHKFVREDERERMDDRDVLGHYLIWNAKESLFKHYGAGSVDFRKHLKIDLSTKSAGYILATIQKPDYHAAMRMKFLILEDEYLLTWIDHETPIELYATATQ
jgi:phosphopantetheinyl transferase